MNSANCKIVTYPYVFAMFVASLSTGGLLSNVGLAQSHSLGMLLSVFPIVFVSVVSGQWRRLSSSELQFVSVILSAILFHFVVVVLMAAPQYSVLDRTGFRFVLSFGFIFLILWSSFQIERYLSFLPPKAFRRLLDTVYKFLVVLAVLSLPFHFLDLVSRKQMLIFSEPSHFALVFGPFYLYKVFTSPYRTVNFFICFGLALLLENLTLIVFSLLGYVLSLRLYGFKLVVSCCLLVILGAVFFIYFQNDNHFIADRLNLSSESKNLSVLVFLSGFERAYLTVFEWSFIGVGFQQMGVIGPLGGIQSSIQQITGTTMNLLDGGTLFSKITVEFGVFGVLMVLLYLNKCWRVYLRLLNLNKYSPAELFYSLCFLGFFVMIFIRGVGYFSPSSFLFIVAVNGLKRKQKEIRSCDS